MGPFEIFGPLRESMRRMTSAFIVLTVLITSISGCIGEDLDDNTEVDSKLISRSGVIDHNFCKLLPSQGSNDNSSNECPTDDETIEDYWSAITNLTSITQNAGEGIMLHQVSGGYTAGVCTSGAIWGWRITPDNGDTFNTAGDYGSTVSGIQPFAGEECVWYLHYRSFENKTNHHWSLTYEIVDVEVE